MHQDEDAPDSKILQRAVQSTEMERTCFDQLPSLANGHKCPVDERMEAEAAALEAMQYYHTVRAASGSTGLLQNSMRIVFVSVPL